MDRPALRLVNEVYEAAARHTDDFTISVTHSRHRGRYLGMSQIGRPCARDIWYSFRSAPTKPKDGRMLQLFNVGDYVEQMQIFWLEQAGYEITDRQADFSDHNGFFRGHPDGLIHGVTQRPHAWDGKSANAKKFDAVKKFGVQKIYPVYFCQAQMMMHYSHTDRAIYTFTNKNNSEWYAERFYYSKTAALALIDRALAAAPDDPYCHYYAGLIRLRAGERENALSDFEAALGHGYPLSLLAQDPQLEPLRGDSRFQNMTAPAKTD